MDYKEKAKRYDDAIERARIWKDKSGMPKDKQGILDDIFPELKESEDERIRKIITLCLNECVHSDIIRDYEKDDAIAWLEKQADKGKLIQELGEYKVKYTQEVLEKYINGMSNEDDERLRKTTIAFLKDFAEQGYENAVECIDWLEKQGEIKSNKWTEGDVVRHGGILALVINGRKAMKSNCEQITIQYPDEWVKAETKERKYFFEELEKQGERKPQGKSTLEAVKEEKVDNANNVEPKFHKGDWIVNNVNKEMFLIKGFNNEYCILENIYGNVHTPCLSPIEDDNHLFTIQDAKDGDVLVCESGWTCIFKTLVDDETFSSYCFMDDTKWFCETGSECHTLDEEYNGKIHPATNEQRDTLMKAMADAGYTFDFEKKELEKIGNKRPMLSDYFKAEYEKGKANAIKRMRSKSAWSEEDEVKINRIVDCLETLNVADYDILLEDVDWLKSLRPQPTWKPSDEQIENK